MWADLKLQARDKVLDKTIYAAFHCVQNCEILGEAEGRHYFHTTLPWFSILLPSVLMMGLLFHFLHLALVQSAWVLGCALCIIGGNLPCADPESWKSLVDKTSLCNRLLATELEMKHTIYLTAFLSKRLHILLSELHSKGFHQWEFQGLRPRRMDVPKFVRVKRSRRGANTFGF